MVAANKEKGCNGVFRLNLKVNEKSIRAEIGDNEWEVAGIYTAKKQSKTLAKGTLFQFSTTDGSYGWQPNFYIPLPAQSGMIVEMEESTDKSLIGKYSCL